MKKILSILLSVIMLATIFPVGMAVASDEEIAEMFESSSGAALSALVYIVDGEIVNMPGFSADKYEYTVKLPEDVYSVAVAAAKADSASTLIVTQPENDNGSGVATVEVIADDGTTKVYTITFVFENMSDATLSSLIYIADGEILSVPGFSADKFEYTVVFDGGVGNVIIAATKSNPASKLNITQPTIKYGKGVATAEVIDKDGAKNVYTINFICEPYAYFTAQDIRVVDDEGTMVIGDFEPGESENLYFIGKLINSSKSNMECFVTMVLYNESGAIEEKVSAEVYIASGKTRSLANYDIMIPTDKIKEGHTVKCFVWEENSISPLCDAVEITFGEAEEEIKPVVSVNYGAVDKVVMDVMGTVSMRLYTADNKVVIANVADRIKLNGVKVDLRAVVTQSELDKMGIYDSYSYVGSSTWFDLIYDIIDGEFVLNGTGDERINKLITYDTSNGEIDEITFAIPSTAIDKFGYIGYSSDVEWQAINNRFIGGKTLSENAIIFNLAGTIDDWKVIKPEDLIDEYKYMPYYFAMQDDATVGVVVMFSASVFVINQDNSLAYFVDAKPGTYKVSDDNEEDVYFVNYYINGKLAEEPLPVGAEYFTENLKANLKPGSAFLFVKNDEGYVEEPAPWAIDKLVVVFRAYNRTVPAGVLSTWDSVLGRINWGALNSFMRFGDGAKLDNEVYTGILVSAADGKLIVVDPAAEELYYVQDDEGCYKFDPYTYDYILIAPDEIVAAADRFKRVNYLPLDKFENIRVPETATVLQYKDYVEDAEKLAVCNSITDLEKSRYTKVFGTQDINLDESDLTYVFFRMKDGVITEVLGLDYVK